MEATLAMPPARELLAEAEPRLRAAGIDTARLDAEVLLAWAMDLGRAALYVRMHEPVQSDDAARFAAAVERRRMREPVAYITGTQEFWSLAFAVSPSVLIPRPETELLIEIVLRARAGDAPAILDLGTGSGCIAIALARELPGARVTAVDLSAEALAVARHNAARHGVGERIAFQRGDLFDAAPRAARFDVIVSNPPYLAPDDPRAPELRHEPAVALDGGAAGLAVVARLIDGAAAHLTAGGLLAVEIGQGQAEAALRLARAAGLVDATVEPDLAGIPRALVARAARG